MRIDQEKRQGRLTRKETIRLVKVEDEEKKPAIAASNQDANEKTICHSCRLLWFDRAANANLCFHTGLP